MARRNQSEANAPETRSGNPTLDQDKVGEVRDISITEIWQKVQCRDLNSHKVLELFESISEHGLLQPITVFQLVDNRSMASEDIPPGKYFILGPGAHRLEACRQLGRDQIRAIVKPYISDEQVYMTQLVEQLHRTDLTFMEQARSLEKLMQIHGDNVARVAAAILWSERLVVKRLALLRLCPAVQKLVEENKLPIGHAELIARIADPETQEAIAIAAVDPAGGDVMSIQYVRDRVQDEMRSLSDVPWDLTKEFAGCVSCASCSNNTSNVPGLFDGDQPAAKRPMCLGGECFEAKSKWTAEHIKDAGKRLVKLSIDKAPTKAMAESEMTDEEREVISPRAVVDWASQKIAAKDAKAGGTSGPASGTGKKAAKEKLSAAADTKFRAAHMKWSMERDRIVNQALLSDPWRAGFACLMLNLPGILYAKIKPALDKVVRKHIKRLSEVDESPRWAALQELMRDLLKAYPKGSALFPMFDNPNDDYMRAMIDALDLGTSIAFEPTIADFAEAPATNDRTAPAKKKTGKKKTKRAKKSAVH